MTTVEISMLNSSFETPCAWCCVINCWLLYLDLGIVHCPLKHSVITASQTHETSKIIHDQDYPKCLNKYRLLNARNNTTFSRPFFSSSGCENPNLFWMILVFHSPKGFCPPLLLNSKTAVESTKSTIRMD